MGAGEKTRYGRASPGAEINCGRLLKLWAARRGPARVSIPIWARTAKGRPLKGYTYG
jgi:hypothetical protein